MKNLTVDLEDRPGALAEMGHALEKANISIEGGGAFVSDGRGIGHFLFADGEAARTALERAGVRVLGVREVLVQRLRQDQPGQLGRLCRKMSDAGVNIEVLYSDHEHQLILVVDDMAKGRAVSEVWEAERSRGDERKSNFAERAK
ncbi:MAG: amino acid-binding ACT domain-containing protein [Acidobacteriota bacterium]|nr:amino acid-binding ACT domain-containing protein [Acidobacteriota bacterium]